MHPHPCFLCQISHCFYRFFVAGILRMNACVYDNSSVFRAVKLADCISGFCHRREFCNIHTHRICHCPGNIRLCAAVCHSFRHVRNKIVHIRRRYNSVAQRFRHAKERTPIHRTAVQSVLKRKNPRIEPIHQRQIFPVASVNLSEIFFRFIFTYINNLVIFCTDIHIVFNLKILIQDCNFFKKHILSSIRLYRYCNMIPFLCQWFSKDKL